ncbi:MAG: nuclear transport factor 2 family protein, partial [Brasilonema sp.]
MIDIDFAQEFANHWVTAWNQHNLPGILSHYTEDFEMTTPMIQKVMGIESGTLQGKEQVGQYWNCPTCSFPCK